MLSRSHGAGLIPHQHSKGACSSDINLRPVSIY